MTGVGDSAPIEKLLAARVLAVLLADPDELRRLRAALGSIEAGETTTPAYTVDSLAAVLGVTPRVVRNAVARGELDAVKRGGRWLIPADAVAAWTHGDISPGFQRPRAPRRRGSSRLKDAFDRLDAAWNSAMSVHRKDKRWVVRYRDEAQRNRSRSFDRKGDADQFNADVVRRRQLGTIAQLDAGKQTLDEFVTEVWAPTHGVTLAPKTRRDYAGFYDRHIAPLLGSVALKSITSELVARWQADRLAAGAGPVALRRPFDLLGSILQLAFEHERINVNPVRRVRKARLPRREEIQPLAPITVERLRGASEVRDAALYSVMAYAGLRPGEALGLRWGDIREQTLLVQRSIALGQEHDTKTSGHRTARLLRPLRTDLLRFMLAAGQARTG